MKLVKTAMLAGLALAVAGGAWAQDVKVDFDKAANFGAIKTFSVKLGTSWGNPFGEKRVTDEVTGALVAKGWTLAPEDKADAQVVLHGASQTKHSLNTYYSGMGGYRWGGVGTSTTTPTEYVVGTLHRVVPPAPAKTASTDERTFCASLGPRLAEVRAKVDAEHPTPEAEWKIPADYVKKKKKRRGFFRRMFGG